MPKESRPLIFRFRGTPENSGGSRYPGCVTFEYYAGGRKLQEVREWLNTMCPDGHQFGTGRKWARNTNGRSSQYDVQVLHIFDRGVAAMFKMVFARTEQEMRQYAAAKRRAAYKRRKAA